jgi:nucleoside-diphosphate-sugar epimerase
MRIFVTGHKGYIGSNLVDVLKQAGHQVTGCDVDLFGGCNWEPVPKADKDLLKDVRQVTVDDCAGPTRMAAPTIRWGRQRALTFDINRDASIRLALAERLVWRYLFSGSCSVWRGRLDWTRRSVNRSRRMQSKVRTESGVELG